MAGNTIPVILACIGFVLPLAGVALIFSLNFFPTTLQPFDLDDRSINHPILEEQFNGVGNLAAGAIIPIIMTFVWILIDYKFERSGLQSSKKRIVFTIYSIIFGVILVNLITHIIKHYRGGLRPNFLAACQPNQTIIRQLRDSKKSWVDLETTKIICTSKEKLTYRWSFPSGHTSNIFYGMLLSILIVNGWDKLWKRYPFALSIKATVQFLLFTFANLVACSRLVDYHHHWYDVAAGALLGAVLAIATYAWFLKPIMAFKEPLPVTQAESCESEASSQPLNMIKETAIDDVALSASSKYSD